MNESVDGLPGGQFGLVLRSVRRARGLRQLDLGLAIGRSHTFVSRLETGSLLPDATDLAQLRLVLDLSVAEDDQLTAAWVRTVAPTPFGEEDLVEAEAIGAACRRLRLGGEAATAWDLSRASARRFVRAAKGARLDDATIRQVVSVSGVLAYEATKAYLDIELIDAPSVGDFRSIGLLHEEICGSGAPPVVRLLNVAREARRYAAGDIQQAQIIGLALLGDPDLASEGGLLVEVLRAVSINAGMLGDEISPAAAAEFLERRADSVGPDERVFLVEGMVRGASSPAERERWVEGLDTEASVAWSGLSATRRCQVVRTMLAVGDGELSRRWVDLAGPTVVEAKERGLSRYVSEITQLLART